MPANGCTATDHIIGLTASTVVFVFALLARNSYDPANPAPRFRRWNVSPAWLSFSRGVCTVLLFCSPVIFVLAVVRLIQCLSNG